MVSQKSKLFVLGLLLCLIGIAIVVVRSQFGPTFVKTMGFAWALTSQGVSVLCLFFGGRFLYASYALK